MLKFLGRLIMRLGGWKTIGELPGIPKAVYIAAPHTSNWDGFWALVYKSAVGLDVHFFAKHSLFWFPLGHLLRAFGGIPLNRGKAGSAVALAVDMFATEDEFNFALAPEGTRRKTTGWKTGFYRIATKASVPVVPGIIDYGRKRIGLAPPIDLTGDQDADLARIAALYEGVEGRHVDQASPVRFDK